MSHHLTDEQIAAFRADGKLLHSMAADRRLEPRREGGIWRCLCPGHDDHEPSCALYDDGHFHCFACEKHGTVFDLVMIYDKVDFVGATRIVAAYRGIAPPAEPDRRPPSLPLGPDRQVDVVAQPAWFHRFWSERCIGARTLQHFGIHASTHPELGRVIVFPYRRGSKLVNRKYRGEGKVYRNDRNTEPALFNGDAINPDEPLYLVEGEIDVLAMHEAGYPNTVSLRDGANSPVEAFGLYAEQLAKVPLFFLAGDMDAAGDEWRSNVSRRLGRHKCRIVSWPEGRKDANDTLRMAAEVAPEDYDEVSIATAISRAKPIPLEGIRDIDEGTIEKAFARPPIPVMRLGPPALSAKIKFPTEGKLIVGTGIPNHGKSSFIKFLAADSIIHPQPGRARRWLMFVGEDEFEEFVVDVSMLVAEKPFGQVQREDRNRVAAILRGGAIRVLECDAERNPATPDSILARGRESILTGDTTDIVIDPYNDLEHDRGGLSETDYTGKTLKRFWHFTHETSCNLWINAHPTKLQVRPGEQQVPPGGYDISGSGHWFNRPDLGYTVWSAAPGKAEILLWKSRRWRWGVKGNKAELDFDQPTGRYLQPIGGDDEPGEGLPAPRWSD